MFREAELSEFTWLALGYGIEVLFLGSIGRGLYRGRSGGTGCGLGFAAGGWCRGCGLHHILMIADHVVGVGSGTFGGCVFLAFPILWTGGRA